MHDAFHRFFQGFLLPPSPSLSLSLSLFFLLLEPGSIRALYTRSKERKEEKKCFPGKTASKYIYIHGSEEEGSRRDSGLEMEGDEEGEDGEEKRNLID